MVEVVKYGATGRRKTSVARVQLTPGAGAITVNEHSFEQYFPRETDRIVILEPLKLTSTITKFDVASKVSGGGKTGQAGAFRLALARALSLCDSGHKSLLKKANCLSRDPRMKERKKAGQK